MTSPDLEMEMNVVPAATILYQPDAEYLRSLLTELANPGRRFFIFVNGPVDESVDKILEFLPNKHIVRVPKNIGLGGGMNAVAQAAISEGFHHLILFDQDSAPTKNLPEILLARSLKITESQTQPAIIGPLLVASPYENYLPIRYNWRDRKLGTVDFVPTSGSLISLPAWREIGPFRDDYFIGGIDVEWGFRAWDKGYSSIVARDIQMIHRWGTIVSQENAWMPQILRQSDSRVYFYIRNAVDCLRLKHIPLGWKVRFATTLCAQISLLSVTRRFSKRTRHVLYRAFLDGWRGRLGPLPSEFAPRHSTSGKRD